MTERIDWTEERIRAELAVCDAATDGPWYGERDLGSGTCSRWVNDERHTMQPVCTMPLTKYKHPTCSDLHKLGLLPDDPCDLSYPDSAKHKTTAEEDMKNAEVAANVAFICRARSGYQSALRELLFLKLGLEAISTAKELVELAEAEQ